MGDANKIEFGQMVYFDVYSGDNQLWTPTIGGYSMLKMGDP